MGLAAEIRAAIGGVSAFEATAREVPPDAVVGGLAFHPVVGLAIGALAAIAATLAAGVVPRAAGFAGFLVLALLGGTRGPAGVAAATEVALDRSDAAGTERPRLTGGVGAGLVLALKCAGLVVLPPPARTAALLLAPLLGAWAGVVQCYGGATGAPSDAASPVGRARFREFGAASLVALGVTFGLAQAIGLAVAVVAALVTVGVRVVAHRRRGGMTPALVAATRELVETSVVGTLAVLAVGPRI